jgi:hypothetical protein|tara:strand:+ start:396 stop:917 length:522 start_codon:yes stop_codon:yes gene_type:complete
MKLRSIIQNKKGQMEYPIIIFIVVIFGLILLSPFILKIFNSFVTPFGSAVGNVTEQAGTNVAHVVTTFVGFWDFVIMIGFLINVILLFITAFLADTNPFFLIIFILFGVFTMIFAPEVLEVLDKIYDSPDFALETSQVEMVDFLRNYFGLIIVGIYFIVGVILYAKFRWSGQR